MSLVLTQYFMSNWLLLERHINMLTSYSEIVKTYPKEKFSSLIPSFNPEGVVCVGVYVGGLYLEDVCWYSSVGLDAHVFVNY